VTERLEGAGQIGVVDLESGVVFEKSQALAGAVGVGVDYAEVGEHDSR
jgi:hypothetical protein